MDALAGNAAFWVLLILLLVVLYILPSLIGLVRGVEYFWLLVVVNLIGGTTCIGWPAALIGAFMLPTKSDRPPNYFYL
ncbi:superinfection immunity protein [Streptosporangium soli]|nr:superinfection immunity protein [Streptosporangium sp. KLBMP 9127]